MKYNLWWDTNIAGRWPSIDGDLQLKNVFPCMADTQPHCVFFLPHPGQPQLVSPGCSYLELIINIPKLLIGFWVEKNNQLILWEVGRQEIVGLQLLLSYREYFTHILLLAFHQSDKYGIRLLKTLQFRCGRRFLPGLICGSRCGMHNKLLNRDWATR